MRSNQRTPRGWPLSRALVKTIVTPISRCQTGRFRGATSLPNRVNPDPNPGTQADREAVEKVLKNANTKANQQFDKIKGRLLANRPKGDWEAIRRAARNDLFRGIL